MGKTGLSIDVPIAATIKESNRGKILWQRVRPRGRVWDKATEAFGNCKRADEKGSGRCRRGTRNREHITQKKRGL